MKSSLLLLLVSTAVLFGCESASRHPALQSDALPELLPVREFFANRRFNGYYTVSPDGRKVAWIGVKGFGPALFVKTIGRSDVSTFKGIPIGFKWAQDSRRLFYLKDQGGDENYHVVMIDSERPDAEAVDLTPHPGIHAMIHRIIRSDPVHILVLHNHRDKELFDLFKINIETGKETLVAENPGDATSFVTDEAGDIVAFIREGGDRMRLTAKLRRDEAAREVLSWDPEETVKVLDVAPDRRSLYLLSNRNRDRVALTRLDVANDRETLLYEEANVDIEEAAVSKVSRQPLFAYSVPGYPKLHLFEANARSELRRFLPDAPRGVLILSTDDSEQKITVKVDYDTATKYYFFDRGTGQRLLLGEGPNTRRAAALASMKPITLRSRDGLTLHGYLTIPHGIAPRSLPMVLLVHGGPWWRDTWDNSLDVEQFLANRGYAVLQVNFRGSTGYGRSFTEAAIGEFAGKMHDDLIDAVNWAIDRGIADPQKIAIMGASYGGYATLVGLSFTPDVFACGVSIVGTSDLARLHETAPKYWKPFAHKFHRYVGDPAIPEERKRMLERSPITRADAVRRPVLMIHTANDARVKQKQADDMVAALKRAGKPVTYVVFPNEGHNTYIWSWPTRLKAYRKIEDFLAQCVGGRSSGFDFYELAAWLF